MIIAIARNPQNGNILLTDEHTGKCEEYKSSRKPFVEMRLQPNQNEMASLRWARIEPKNQS